MSAPLKVSVLLRNVAVIDVPVVSAVSVSPACGLARATVTDDKSVESSSVRLAPAAVTDTAPAFDQLVVKFVGEPAPVPSKSSTGGSTSTASGTLVRMTLLLSPPPPVYVIE